MPKSLNRRISSAELIFLFLGLSLLVYSTWEKSNDASLTCPTVICHRYSSLEHHVFARRKSII